MRFLVFIFALMQVLPVQASEARVAVASNFLSTLKALADVFEEQTPYRLQLVPGSTGKLYAQILHGAPFHVFLAADERRPELLEDEGMAIRGKRLTYATGRLVLWSPDLAYQGADCLQVLRDGGFRYLSIANPKIAPYGEAARATLQQLGLWDALQSKLVRGENINQTFQFVVSGNAQLGMVALSQLVNADRGKTACRWDVPEHYHTPLKQQAVLLKKGADNRAALAFMEFIQGKEARNIIVLNGYGTD